MDTLQTICILVLTSLFAGCVTCLQCWHCIADNCGIEPSDNYKATKKPCITGQSCQKVYFEMFDEVFKTEYTSTVRGCSSECALKNDFLNCTHQLRTTRGCIRKDCCQDSDLCNGSDNFKTTVTLHVCLGLTAMTWLIR